MRSHPLAGNGIVRFSGRAQGSSFLSLLNGRLGSVVGAPVAFQNAILGSMLKCSGATDRVNFSGQNSENTAAATIAGLVVLISTSTAATIFCTSSASSGGWLLRAAQTTGVVEVVCPGIVALSSGIALTVGVPYFVAASVNASNCNYTVLDMRTGVLKTATSAGASPGIPNGTYCVGGDFNNFTGFAVADVMFSNGYLPMSVLHEATKDPFSFWDTK